MTNPYPHLTLDQPAIYCFKFQGRVTDAWSDFLKNVSFQHVRQEDGTTVTVLSGTVADQASLHGLLNRIRDLGLPLLLIELVNVCNE
jgi:hypothetical protein